ncbi:MAG: peptidoglycan -binding protein, partial [Alphaproteobacteria bacterium]
LELSQADIDTLTAALEESRAASATLTATLEQRDSDLEELKAALEASQTRTAEAVARLELSQADIDALTAALEESGTTNATLSATLESRDASIAELQAALEASQTRTADAIAQLQLSQADIAVLTAALDEARLDTNLLTVAVEDREADLAALRETLLASEADRAAMAAALEETRAAGDELSNRLRLSDEEILRLRDLLASRELAVGTLTAERDAAAAQRDQTAAQRDAETARADGLTVELRLSEEDRQRLLAQLTAIRDRSQVLAVELSDAEGRTALAQRAIDERDIRIDELVAAMATTEAALDEEVRLSTQSRVLVAELNQRIDALRDQLAQVQVALETSEASVGDRDIEIADLNARLNQALVRRIEELNRYRSEFFGRLREVIGRRDDIRVVGDRFVFQSEVLFPSGSATLQAGGKEQLDRFADTLLEIAADFPPEIDWILRVDGHTDRVPIRTPEFPSNWELSTARATEVVKFLIERGVPQDRLAAAGFGEFQPLDTTNTFAAFRRNRRIELKLDQR